MTDAQSLAESFAKLDATANRIADERNLLLTALRGLIDVEDCHYDHHGYCQTHGQWKAGICPQALAKQTLQRIAERKP
jgi:hypothetical protein